MLVCTWYEGGACRQGFKMRSNSVVENAIAGRPYDTVRIGDQMTYTP